MPLEFYTANSKQTGSAVFFDCRSTFGALFVKLIKQTGWDATNKKGTFSGGKMINVKLNAKEIGGFLKTLDGRDGDSPYLFHHQFEDNVTKGSFKYATFTVRDKIREGFLLSVINNDDKYTAWFELDNAECLKEYLRFALHRIFTAIHAEDKRQAEERLQKEKAKQAAKPTPKAVKKEESPIEDIGGDEGENADDPDWGDPEL